MAPGWKYFSIAYVPHEIRKVIGRIENNFDSVKAGGFRGEAVSVGALSRASFAPTQGCVAFCRSEACSR
ncbi:hypothetical protein PCL1606_05510 [Pseudomonas chlororaphis]|uniref:Uncharacterized protein n=1 Tax=Pseudomonas chlororaphis TaxID=587753 RepID=A0A0D5XSD4_9PSED|nr:hypothetical protein PCL1606_05510 [Pseudomonas chlororaphis]